MSIFVGSRQVLDVMGTLNENFVALNKAIVLKKMSSFMKAHVQNHIGVCTDNMSDEDIVRCYTDNTSEEIISIIEYSDEGCVLNIILGSDPRFLDN